MIIDRQEGWGVFRYDTLQHRFSLIHANGKDAIPYGQKPVVLNIYLTMKCNMACMHCVTKDFEAKDLVISPRLVDWINSSPFMVVVITGGEPLLPEYENRLIRLLREIRNKGLIIDTNGTILPSHSVIKEIIDTNALVRISLDSPRPQDEIYYRHLKPNTKENRDTNRECYYTKLAMIKRLRSAGVAVAIQSVIHSKNLTTTTAGRPAGLARLPDLLHKMSITQWYIQRFIPSYKARDKRFEVSNVLYDKLVGELAENCRRANIECIAKKDRRHNCVIMLVGEGILYTQGPEPGQKLRLGTIDSEIRYFEYVSSADHAERYYR